MLRWRGLARSARTFEALEEVSQDPQGQEGVERCRQSSEGPHQRSRLQKEIWEDEGVIVGRSLDMFISKLRKKLELDPNINIVVIRGKGYKLEISSQENLPAPN